MIEAVRNFLKDEDRALTVLIGGSMVIMAVGFVIAVAAIVFMK